MDNARQCKALRSYTGCHTVSQLVSVVKLLCSMKDAAVPMSSDLSEGRYSGFLWYISLIFCSAASRCLCVCSCLVLP